MFPYREKYAPNEPATTKHRGLMLPEHVDKLTPLLWGPNGEILLDAAGAGGVGRYTRRSGPQEDVHLRTGDDPGSYGFFESRNNIHLCVNCRWDGLNWVRIDTTQPAYVRVLTVGGAWEFWQVAAGANPITWQSTAREALDSSGRLYINSTITSIMESAFDTVQLSGGIYFEPADGLWHRYNANQPGKLLMVESTLDYPVFHTDTAAIPSATATLAGPFMVDYGNWPNAGQNIKTNANWNSNTLRTGMYSDSASTGAPTANWWNMINVRHPNDALLYAFQLACDLFSLNLYVRNSPGTSFAAWKKLPVIDNEHHSEIRLGANQTIASGTFTRLNFNSVLINRPVSGSSIAWDTTNFRFACQVAGVYHFDAGANYQAFPDGSRFIISLFQSGGGEIYRMADRTVGAATDATIDGSCTVRLTAGQIVEIQTWHNTGANRTVLANNGSYVCATLVG